MVALVAGIFGNVEPLLCLTRSGVALIAGMVVGAFIQALIGVPAVGGSNPNVGDGATGLTTETES
ncbi:MAG: hypothetical protein C4320_02220 [Armatimonadota bacterium]